MIIKITRDEIKGFVAAALNLNPERFTVEIADLPSTNAPPELAALRRAIAEFPPLLPGNKIPCIKRFRDLCPRKPDVYGGTSPSVGLADAKWAVENPDFALRNLMETGKLRGSHTN